MRTLRNVCFSVLCVVLAISWETSVKADWFTLPGMGCGCEDPFFCEGECGNACLQVCQLYSVTCHTWDYLCWEDECWCGYEPTAP